MNDNWIQTYTGKKVYPFGPFGPKDVDIRDIAHSLAHQCRWRGHCKKFYSIAEHSVLVSEEIDEDLALDGLLHDAAEAYVGDTPTPLKKLVPDLMLAEQLTIIAIRRKFDTCVVEPYEVVRADLLLQISEIEQLMPDPQMFLEASWKERYEGHDHRVRLHCWIPALAEWKFLRRFSELRNP